MAKDIDNSWTSSANYVSENSLTRTNQWAEAQNVIKLYGVEATGTRFSVGFTWAITSAGDQLAFTPGTGSTTASDYFKLYVVDKSGNEAYAKAVTSAPTTVVNISTSSLNPDDDWKCLFHAANGSGGEVKFGFEIATGAIYGNSSAAVAYTL